MANNFLIARKEAVYEIKKSKFLAFSYPIHNETEINEYLTQLRKTYHDARHICYAYTLKTAQNQVQKYSDDGEPQGTAGLPLLNLIKNNHLENVLLVVVRYFGGIKLGASNLLRAYMDSAKLVLNNNIRAQEYIYTYKLSFSYALSKPVEKLMYETQAQIIEQSYLENGVEYLIKLKKTLDAINIQGLKVIKLNEGWE